MIFDNFSMLKPYFLETVKKLGTLENQILVQDKDISCKCPVCGDSKYSKNKKRLHLYQKGDVININCFNGDCDVKNLAPYKFFKLYDFSQYQRIQEQEKRVYFDTIRKKEDVPKLDLEQIGLQDFFKETENETVTNEQIIEIVTMIEDFGNALKKDTIEDYFLLEQFLIEHIKPYPLRLKVFQAIYNSSNREK